MIMMNQPIEIGQRLRVGLVLDQLLSASMQQPDVWVRAQHGLEINPIHIHYQIKVVISSQLPLRPVLEQDATHHERPGAGAQS